MISLCLLALITVSVAQYATAPRYGVSNYYGYGNYYGNMDRQYYQNQYAMQNYYNSYNQYYNNYYRNYYNNPYNQGYYSNSRRESSWGSPSFLGFRQDENGNWMTGNKIAAFYLTCNGKGCPVRG